MVRSEAEWRLPAPPRPEVKNDRLGLNSDGCREAGPDAFCPLVVEDALATFPAPPRAV
jgi:hypothetical protein